jgi:hypothetical protein
MNTPEFRVSYPNVFKAKKNEMNGKDEYSVVALFKKGADLSALQKAAEEACIEKWGADKNKWPRPLRSPFRDQGERAKEGVLPEGYEQGAIFINLKSNQRPGVVDSQVQEIIDTSQFYAGCYAIASFRAYAYGGPGTKFPAGVAFGLGNVQKTRDGDPLSGRTLPTADFKPIEGAQDATGGSADNIFG